MSEWRWLAQSARWCRRLTLAACHTSSPPPPPPTASSRSRVTPMTRDTPPATSETSVRDRLTGSLVAGCVWRKRSLSWSFPPPGSVGRCSSCPRRRCSCVPAAEPSCSPTGSRALTGPCSPTGPRALHECCFSSPTAQHRCCAGRCALPVRRSLIGGCSPALAGCWSCSGTG